MDFDLQWFVLALPVAFGLGWMASRLDLRQVRRENRDHPRAYFKGLNLLLNEQQDKAVDAFIEAVQNDPDTAELHFALGNLFRRRGEFERAVRVHEHLLGRGDLKAADRQRAQYALAQDFMRAGLFDRAEQAYQKLDATPFEGEAQLALLTLHERSRSWAAAINTAAQLEAAGRGSFASRVAHYECEQSLEADAQGRSDEAAAALQRALVAAPGAARALTLAGQRLLQADDAAGAVDAWDQLRAAQPAAFGLVAQDYVKAARASGRQAQAGAALDTLYASTPSMALLRARIALVDFGVNGVMNGVMNGVVIGGGPGSSNTGVAAAGLIQALAHHLQASPSLSAAQALLEQPPPSWGESGLAGIRAAVARAAKPLQRYRCAACGFEAKGYFWQCPGCQSWDSFPPQPVEEL